MVSEGFTSCVRERKRYQNTINKYTEIDHKSMKNQCRIDARKSDAKIMEKGAEMDPNGKPTNFRNHFKIRF